MHSLKIITCPDLDSDSVPDVSLKDTVKRILLNNMQLDATVIDWVDWQWQVQNNVEIAVLKANCLLVYSCKERSWNHGGSQKKGFCWSETVI